MNILDILKRRNIVTTEIQKWSTYLRNSGRIILQDTLLRKKLLYSYTIMMVTADICGIYSAMRRECLKGKRGRTGIQSTQKDTFFYQQSDMH